MGLAGQTRSSQQGQGGRLCKRGKHARDSNDGGSTVVFARDPCAAATAFVRETMLCALVLANVFRSKEASVGSIAWLCELKLVSKHWCGAVLATLADRSWRCPFHLSGVLYAASMLQLGEELDAGEEDSPLDTLMRVCQGMHAFALREDAQCTGLSQQHLALCPCPNWTSGALATAAKRVATALQAFPDSRAVRLGGLVVLADIVRVGGSHGSCALQNGALLPLLVQAIDRFGPSPAAVDALMDFMGRSSLRIRLYHNALVDAGVLGALSGALQSHSGHLAFQVAGLRCLLDLALLHPREVVQAGAPALALACMRSFPDSVEAQRAGISLLANLESHNLTTEHRHCVADVDYFASSLDGIQLMVDGALGAGGVCRDRGLELLVRIADRTRGGLARVARSGFVSLVLAVMEAVAVDGDGAAQRTGCSILSSMASLPECRRQVAGVRVQEQVREAMRQSPTHWTVQMDACRVFCCAGCCVGCARGASKPTLALAGVIPLVVSAVRRNMLPRHRWWQSRGILAGIAALVGFMQSRRNIGTVSDAGAVRVLLPALADDGSCMEVAGAACSALAVLATHDKNSAFLQEHGAVQLALQVFTSRHSTPPVRVHALGLLSRLVAGHPHTHAAFRAQHGIDALLGAALDPESQKVAGDLIAACSA
jgi:hypothetical protein